MAKFELEQGEKEIDTWTIMYQMPKGDKFNGKLMVSDKRLVYDAQFDMSVGSLIDQAFLVKTEGGPVISIPKSKIKKVDVEKKFFSKKVIITLNDDSKHIFNYGMLSVDKLVDAVRVGCKL
ncbi:PH domain-containing protein [Patescibacteria group bacterium]